MKETFTYVTTEESLFNILPILQRASSVAVDVEFDNKYSYDVVICLIQISTGSNTYLIDPFEVNPEPLKSIFEDPETIMIFFAGIQDVQLLQTTYGWQVRSVVDLSTIYQFVNDDDQQTSLNDVISDVLSIDIPKNKQIQSREDWKQRPLPMEMQVYAARDVIYLHKALVKLQKQLEPESQKLLEVYFQQIPLVANRNEGSLLYAFDLCSRYRVNDERERYLIFSLIKFREDIAQTINESGGYIISKSNLKKLVSNKPTSIHELKEINVFYGNIKRYGHEILEIIRNVYSKHEEPSEYYRIMEEKYQQFYPYYKYLDYDYNWVYDIPFNKYKNRRGSLRIIKQMLIDRFGEENIGFLYSRHLNHQIARHEEISLFDFRREIEETSSDQELIDVIYAKTMEVYQYL